MKGTYEGGVTEDAGCVVHCGFLCVQRDCHSCNDSSSNNSNSNNNNNFVRGSDTISMMGILFLFKTGLGGMIPGEATAHVSRSARPELAGS